MSEYRQDFITKEWVIIAPERSKRPDQFRQHGGERKELPVHEDGCPFCPGNEHMTPPHAMIDGAGGEWRLRVIPNKFAAVSSDASPVRRPVGCFLTADGFGIAEVIIENRAHNATFATMSVDEIGRVIHAYRARFMVLAANPNVDLITVFRNSGARAGTSLEHPHSQIIATPIVSPNMRRPLQQALLYHDSYGTCPYCVMLGEELKQGKRIICEGSHFVSFCPFASALPFQIMVVPKRHSSQFCSITDEEIGELAETLSRIFRTFHKGLSDPDYNFFIHSSPLSDGELHYDHWRLTIVPRLTTAAGFEIGSNLFINVMPPEDCAGYMRELA